MYLQNRTAVLVDPHPLWLGAVTPVVARIGVDVVGSATSPETALRLVEELRPDILVTELRLDGPGMDGVAFVREARQRVPELRVIVLSMYEDRHHIDAALDAGAVAYVIKTAHPDDIAAAIRQGFEHSLYLANAARPVATVAENAPRDAKTLDLTRRELEILQLVAEGFSNAELARRLWVTEQTVKFHLSNIYRKLDVANRTEASRWAQLNGLLASASPAAAAVA
jgi:DNA-binding NarL/FixJ family response regulator